MRHKFNYGTRRPALDEQEQVESQGGDLEDHAYMFDMSDGVEAMLAQVYACTGKAGPVQRLADMPPEKQAEMIALYGKGPVSS